MIWNIKNDIWFDSDLLYIIKGNANYLTYRANHSKYPPFYRKSRQGRLPTIVFLSSTACNLKCRYCFANAGTYNSVSKRRFFTADGYKYIYDLTIKQYGGVKTISFFGGEPLLNFSEIEKFVDYIYRNYRVLPYIGISSNGTIMNDHIKRFLTKYAIHFGTSLDGPKKFNDINRIGSKVKSVYDRVSETLLNLADSPIKKGIQITISKVHVENYNEGDIISWIKDLEKMKVNDIELVPVTSGDKRYQIDLDDNRIYTKYLQLCEDYASYWLDVLKNDMSQIMMSNIFVGLILHIIKREYQEDCNAGFSFCVSPDLKAYPCHVCAGETDFGIKYDKNFRKRIKVNVNFQKVISIEKSKLKE